MAVSGYGQVVGVASGVYGYASNLPNMDNYEIAHGIGFGVEKKAEFALISRGAGLVGGTARTGTTITRAVGAAPRGLVEGCGS